MFGWLARAHLSKLALIVWPQFEVLATIFFVKIISF
jgi:hypothetical protein